MSPQRVLEPVGKDGCIKLSAMGTIVSCVVKPRVIASVHFYGALQWRHNGRDGISNHQPFDCLLNRLFRHRSENASKLRVTGLCAANSPVTSSLENDAWCREAKWMTEGIMLHEWKCIQILKPVLCIHYIAGLAHDYSNSIVNSLELLQLCAKPMILLYNTGKFLRCRSCHGKATITYT